MKKLSDHILNILYPRCCPLCHRILEDPELLVCSRCAASVRPVPQPRCMRCGKPVREGEEYCRGCSGGKRSFDQGRGIFLYDQRMKASILRYKYDGRRQYGDFYARAMCRYAEADIKRWKPEMILPIPLHPRKLRMRGFNQAEYIADRVGGYFGIPVRSGMLKKIKNTGSQKKMDREQRRYNLLKAFAADPEVKGRRILLIDDVFTTGSTIDAAAKCLKNAGASSVFFLTVCIGREESAE